MVNLQMRVQGLERQHLFPIVGQYLFQYLCVSCRVNFIRVESSGTSTWPSRIPVPILVFSVRSPLNQMGQDPKDKP